MWSVYGRVYVGTLCLGKLQLLQPMFAQMISGQVLPCHQSNHLQKVTNQRKEKNKTNQDNHHSKINVKYVGKYNQTKILYTET